jgi:hypothetical protein
VTRIVPNGSFQAHRAKAPGGVLAKPVRDKAVRSFLKREGDNHRNGPDGEEIDRLLLTMRVRGCVAVSEAQWYTPGVFGL